MPEYLAGRIADYADGDRKVLSCGDAEVGVFRIEGQFHAWHNRCSHLGGPDLALWYRRRPDEA
jgi:nitrite reductase (NADH) small subunit